MSAPSSTPAHAVRPARVLRIYCPIDQATLVALMSGQQPTVNSGGPLGAMLAIIAGDTPLGDFGRYRSVVELAPGWELFTPGADANPTLGAAGAAAASPTAILTVFIPHAAPPDAVNVAIDALIAVHPWEIPVIELNETFLIVRA